MKKFYVFYTVTTLVKCSFDAASKEEARKIVEDELAKTPLYKVVGYAKNRRIEFNVVLVQDELEQGEFPGDA